MIMRSFVAGMIAIVASSAQATNRGYWDLWAIDVAMVCFAQNSAYRNTPLGNMLLKSNRFAGWEAFDRLPSTVCLRSKQWVSDRLCTEVTNLDETTFHDLGQLRRKHDAELQGLKDVIVYQYNSKNPNSSFPCPASK